MKKTAILLIFLLILTTGCQALATTAEVNLTEAQTQQIEVQSDAETIAALVAELRERDDLDQAIIDALLAELEAGEQAVIKLRWHCLNSSRGYNAPAHPGGLACSLPPY